MIRPARTAVVGGGILGCVLALRFAERGDSVVLYEAAPILGGLAAPWQLADVTWDRHYHVVLGSDRRVLRLLGELGLHDALRWSEIRTGVYGGGRMHSLSSAADLLRFPLLDPVAKARLALTMLRGARLSGDAPLDDVPVEAWLRRWSGDRAFERFWRPLLVAKLGEGYREASASFIRATIARLYAARSAGLAQQRYGTIRGGYAPVFAALERRLVRAGVSVRCGAPVASVDAHAGGGLRVASQRAPAEHVDRVVLTVPASIAATIARALDASERERLAGVRYQGVVCTSLLLRREPWPFYVTNIVDDGLPFSAVVSMNALTGAEPFGGRALVYLPKYADSRDAIFGEPAERVESRFAAAFLRMAPGLGDHDVLAARTSRVREVFALPALGFAQRRPPIRTTHPGVFVVNGAQIVDATLNVEETLALGERALETIDGASAPRSRAVAC